MVTRRRVLETLAAPPAAPGPGVALYPHLFSPLKFRNLTVKNRVFRSNVSGRFDHYDGCGTQARINWELKFARGGVGAIISSFVPVAIRGRIMPNYATIDRDSRADFWKDLITQVHGESDCKYLIQLSHGGRQRDVPDTYNRFVDDYPWGLLRVSQDQRVRGSAARRRVAAGAVSAQRIGAVARRVVRGGGQAPPDVLSRIRRVRSDPRGVRVRGRRRAADRYSVRHPPAGEQRRGASVW